MKDILAPRTACSVRNARQFIRSKKVRFHFDQERGLYYAEQGDIRQYFARRKRGFKLYRKGLDYRANRISSTYLIDRIDFSKDDIVVDCGANYADLFLFLKGKIRPENYISFEPGAEEFSCIALNAPESRNFNLGLSNKTGETVFYASSKDANSSIVRPKEYTSEFVVRTMTLDDFVEQEKIESIKLLKLEAEGFEPEVLDGFSRKLGMCAYVAIDGGYERGESEEETFSVLTNKLLTRGFEMLGANLKWGRALFRRADAAELLTH